MTLSCLLAPLRGRGRGAGSRERPPRRREARPAWALRRRPRLRPSPRLRPRLAGSPRSVAGGAFRARLRSGHRLFCAHRFRGGGGGRGAVGGVPRRRPLAPGGGAGAGLDPPRRAAPATEAGVAPSSAGGAPLGPRSRRPRLSGASVAAGEGGGATAADLGSSAGAAARCRPRAGPPANPGPGGRRGATSWGDRPGRPRGAAGAPRAGEGGPALRLHRLPRGAGHRRRGLRRRERALPLRRLPAVASGLAPAPPAVARPGEAPLVRLRLGHGDQALDGLCIDGLIRVRRRHLGERRPRPRRAASAVPGGDLTAAPPAAPAAPPAPAGGLLLLY